VLQGPSGSGKSTWLALVAGLLAPQAGELLVAGQSPAALPERARDAWRARTIGFLPQRLHLSAALTVQQNLQLACFAAGALQSADEAQAAIDSTLQALGVADLAARRPSQISGGQALRVALARCVLLGPQVILADEPTASLDDAAALAALQLLQSTAQRQGASLVVATHDARVSNILVDAEQMSFLGQTDHSTTTGGHKQLLNQ
jgi:putative ABC transport system ATP-binding protein